MTFQTMQSRRSFLTLLAATPMLAISGVRAQAQAMISWPGSGYRFLPGGPVWAGGAVAEPGFEVVHALLARWLPLELGYALVEGHLKSLGRPMQALCGLQLRLPRQLSVKEFSEFNAPYVARLKGWDLVREGLNPISRINVTPAQNVPQEPSLHAFTYTVPSDRKAATFTMSGIPELGPGPGINIIALGDVSPEGMHRKLAHVISAVSNRLVELGFDWHNATHVDYYSAIEISGAMDALTTKASGAMRRGVRWHHGRPPVVGLELELEARAVAREIIVGS